MKQRTEGHTNTSISSDTRADWSAAFELVASLQAAYVWHASVFTREVLDGLLRIGFLYPQQIIWNKGTVSQFARRERDARSISRPHRTSALFRRARKPQDQSGTHAEG